MSENDRASPVIHVTHIYKIFESNSFVNENIHEFINLSPRRAGPAIYRPIFRCKVTVKGIVCDFDDESAVHLRAGTETTVYGFVRISDQTFIGLFDETIKTICPRAYKFIQEFNDELNGFYEYAYHETNYFNQDESSI
jgi:hypothetical protein